MIANPFSKISQNILKNFFKKDLTFFAGGYKILPKSALLGWVFDFNGIRTVINEIAQKSRFYKRLRQ